MREGGRLFHLAAMSDASFLSAITTAPAPFDGDFARQALDRLSEAGGVWPEKAEPLLLGVFGGSPYLARLSRLEADWLDALFAASPAQSLDRILQQFRAAGAEALDEDALNTSVRKAKRRLHLLTGFADLGGVWTLADVSRAMSGGADAALQSGLLAHARFMAASGRIPQAAVTAYGLPGLFVIALGKLGSEELNYSSDVDLAVFFERDRLDAAGVDEPGRTTARLVRRLARTLEEPTEDGFVFRTDFRLRPDPASTPLTLSTEAAGNYYESFAQTWERAAWIKARACAGDLEAGQAFLDRLRPFIWRKSMDYGAIDEIVGMMRQIEAGAGEDGPGGYDLKRGSGGIRQIEFYAQIHQLLQGGREPQLRIRAPQKALAELARRGDIGARDAETLSEIYNGLRTAENRLQMVEDQHTHETPEEPERRRRLALLCGYDSTESFDDWLTGATRTTREICRDLFDADDAVQDDIGLLFDGPDPTPKTLNRLTELGFENPESVWETVRGWLIGKPRATRTERGRRLIKDLAPRIVMAVAETGHPNTAFLRFTEFLNGLPAGVNILSMFEREPALLNDIADALGLAPRLARQLARRPEALEAFVAPGADALDFEDLDAAAREAVDGAEDYEAALDNARRFARETLLRVGVAALRDQAAAGEAGRARARVAGSLVRALLPAARRETARLYGDLDATFAVIGLGSFGMGEMTYTSDLDLMVIYESRDEASRGQRSLSAGDYCARVTKRLMNALSVETAEGPLFEVDLNLRPSGSAGPIAVSLAAFRRYYSDAAWTWEMMALTRARLVAGPEDFQAEVAGVIEGFLRRKRDREETAADVAAMRERLAAERPPRGFWDLKRAPGGMTDLEFTVQYLQLIHAHDHPHVLSPVLPEALNALADAHIFSQDEAGAMARAARLNLDLLQLLALAVEGRFEPDSVPLKLKQRLAKAGGTEDFAALEEKLAEARRLARRAYERIVLSAAR